MNSDVRLSQDHPLPVELRRLRREGRDGRAVQQQELAQALGVAKSTVAGWERIKNPTPPRAEWLSKIATFYAVNRRASAGELLRLPVDLTAEQRSIRDSIYTDLLGLAHTAPDSSPAKSLLQFPASEPIRIISGEIPRDQRAASAERSHVNHIALQSNADLDAVVAVYGRVNALNPVSDIQIRKTEEIGSRDPNSHLILVGNLLRVQDGESRILSVSLPVKQVADPESPDGEPFEFKEGDEVRRYTAKYLRDRSKALAEYRSPIIEDVGFLARMPNPINHHYTLTIFSGVHTLGVLGAVQTLTDPDFHDTNQEYLKQRFENARSFGILMRVNVLGRSVPAPDFRNDDCRIFEYDLS